MYSKKKYTYKEALTKIQRYCALQERSHFDVSTKLREFGLSKDEADTIIIELISDNFLNEERFAEAFVSGKFNIKKWGKIKIKQHLKQKAVSERNILFGLKQIEDDTYIHTLNELIHKKSELLGDIPITDKKIKITRYLLSKGYEQSLIYEHLNNYLHH